jgi:hypothetical protein
MTTRLDRALVIAALGLTLVLGPATIYAAKPKAPTPAPTAPLHGPGAPNFGTMPSSGNSVVDCGEAADHDNDLSPAARENLEACLDLHGWTYDD